MILSELVKKYDPENQFDVLRNSYQQIEYARDNKFDLIGINEKSIKNIIISGLGGSAISGDLLLNFLNEQLSLPVQVNRNYLLPKYADEETLIVASSYSGNTEETISVLQEALKKKCQIICITTGGKVEEIAKVNKLSVVRLQKGFQPRYTLGMSFFSLLAVLAQLKVIKLDAQFLEASITLWKEKGAAFSSDNNDAFLFAESLVGFIPIIYSCADLTSAVGNRFKCQLNENSKVHAFHNIFPELNHNEIIGWETNDDRIAKLKVMLIEEQCMHPQIKKRFSITKELLVKAGVEVVSVKSDERSFQLRLLDLIYLLDWVSYYLALLRKHDPSEIEYIHLLKKKLAE